MLKPTTPSSWLSCSPFLRVSSRCALALLMTSSVLGGVACGGEDPISLSGDATPPARGDGGGGGRVPSDAGTDGAVAPTPIGDPEIVADDISFQFNPVAAAPQSAPARFKFTNRGGGLTSPLAVDVHGNDYDAFSVVSQDCIGKQLAAGESCSVTIALRQETDGEYSATLRVHTDKGGVARVDLSGRVTPAALAFTPQSLVLGDTFQGEAGPIGALTLTNMGGATSGPVVVGAGITASFRIANDLCTGVKLVGGQSCRVDVQAVAALDAIGTLTGTVPATSQPGGAASAQVSAATHANATLVVDNAYFGSVGYLFGNTPGAQTVRVTNRGERDAETIYVNRAVYFTIDDSDCAGRTLAPNAWCSLVVTPKSRYVGDLRDTITVTPRTGHPGTAVASISYTNDGHAVEVTLPQLGGTVTSSDGQTCASASCTFKYRLSDPVPTLTAVPTLGYHFSSWQSSWVYSAYACPWTSTASCYLGSAWSTWSIGASPVFYAD